MKTVYFTSILLIIFIFLIVKLLRKINNTLKESDVGCLEREREREKERKREGEREIARWMGVCEVEGSDPVC